MRRARIIRIEIEHAATGMLYATSPDMRELFVGRRSLDGLKEAVPQTIVALMEERGETVKVYEAEDGDSFNAPPPWVVIPEDAAARC